jgi:hypothetical protein
MIDAGVSRRKRRKIYASEVRHHQGLWPGTVDMDNAYTRQQCPSVEPNTLMTCRQRGSK